MFFLNEEITKVVFIIFDMIDEQLYSPRFDLQSEEMFEIGKLRRSTIKLQG
jgi:hypothetical protein